MITDVVIGAFTFVASAVAGLFPDLPEPTFLTSAASAVSAVTGYLAGFGAWVPFGHATAALGLLAAALAAALVIKVVRIAASFLTLGGGSAA